MDDSTIRAAREIDAVPILPRDCDGGTVDLAAAAAGYDPDDVITTTDHSSDVAYVAHRLDCCLDMIGRLDSNDTIDDSFRAEAAEHVRKAIRALGFGL